MTTHFFTGSHPATQVVPERSSWKRYLVLGLAANALIWGAAIGFITLKKPSYTSEWSITLPPSGNTTQINLPEIGAASSRMTSPYELRSQDPREIYKYLATSDAVVKAAAAKVNMPVSEYGKPRIKIVDNTTVVSFQNKGTTADVAQAKAQALYEALQERLTELRTQEATEQTSSSQAVLRAAQQKVEAAQKRLSDFKVRSGLASNTQINDLASNIEQLRRQRAEIVAQQQEAGARGNQLSVNLKLSPTQAASAFSLQSDPVFQKYYQDFSSSSATLVNLTSKFMPNHPSVIDEKAKRDAAQAALFSRGQQILGRPMNQSVLVQLTPGGNDRPTSSARETLSQALLTAQSEQQGLKAQARELDRQIGQLETRLKTMARYGSTLEGLTRDLQIAEAVFSSTLASLDIGKANVFGSYPPIQLLADPSLPLKPSSTTALVLLGAGLASVLVSSGLGTLALRNRHSMQIQSAKVRELVPVENGHVASSNVG